MTVYSWFCFLSFHQFPQWREAASNVIQRFVLLDLEKGVSRKVKNMWDTQLPRIMEPTVDFKMWGSA